MIEKRKELSPMFHTDRETIYIDPGLRGCTPMLADAQLKFPSYGFSVPYKGPHVDLYHYIVESRGGYQLRFTNFHPPIGIVVSREAFIKGMEKEALDAGVTIQCETTAMQGENTAKGARVKVQKKDESTEWIEARYVIAADGLHTQIVRASGFPLESTPAFGAGPGVKMKEGPDFSKEREKLSLRGKGPSESYEMVNVDWPYPHAMFRGNPNFQGNPTPWVNPLATGEGAYSISGGAGTEGKEYIFKKSKWAPYFKNAKFIRKFPMTIREGYNALWYPLHGNILAVGDAACLGSLVCLYQGALISGWAAGNAMSKAINNKVHLSRYMHEYQSVWTRFEVFRYPNQFEVGEEWGPRFEELHALFADDEIDAIHKVLDGEPLERALDHRRVYLYLWSAIYDRKDKLEKIKSGILKKIRNMKEEYNKQRGSHLRWEV
jgi:flavin-dependent dehydrogenase